MILLLSGFGPVAAEVSADAFGQKLPRTASSPQPAEYTGIAIGAAGTLYSEAAYGKPSQPLWTAHNGFDQCIRSGLRLGSNAARDAVGNFGDVLMGLLIAEPVVDSGPDRAT